MTFLSVLALLIGILILFLAWRRMHQRAAQERFEYRIYALRDRLRRLVIDGKLNCNSELFQYYDATFSKIIEESYYLTFFYILLLKIAHYDDETIKEVLAEIEKKCQDYPQMQEIREEYLAAARAYLVEQHMITFKFLLKPSSS